MTEILLQRTRAEVVAAFLGGFFETYPDWQALSAASLSDLERQLRPIGLQAKRARALRSLADHVQRGGELGASAPGFGQYVTRALAVGVSGAKVAMVDANFVRVLTRVYAGEWMSDYRFDRRLQGIAKQVVEAAHDPRVVNWAVLDLGATVCLPRRPRCDECPLANQCRWFAEHPSGQSE